MAGRRIGSTIAAAFGLVYVLVNTGALPMGWSLTLRLLALVAFVAILVAVVRVGPPRDVDGPSGPVFGRAYQVVVAVELVALFGGARLLSGPIQTPEAGVAWVSTVVGVHFFALAVVFGERFFHVLGALVTACGVIGLVLALAGAGETATAVVAGVVPGALLLASGWWGAHRTALQATPTTVAALGGRAG